MKKYLIIFITLFITINIFINYNEIILSVNDITYIFITRIFPPLFLFFIISSILVNYEFVDIISNTLGIIISKLFKINKYSSYVFFMSMLSGLPGNAKYTNELIDKGLISEKDGEKILLFSHFANPLFILSVVSHRPLLVLFCHYFPNLIIGILFRNYNINKNVKSTKLNLNKKTFINVLSESIKDSLNLLLGVLGIIVVFYVISLVSNNIILKYILEMSSSITFINLFDISNKFKTLLITGILSFGGICVHMQVLNILENKKIRYKPYLFARIIHFILSISLVYILY